MEYDLFVFFQAVAMIHIYYCPQMLPPPPPPQINNGIKHCSYYNLRYVVV